MKAIILDKMFKTSKKLRLQGNVFSYKDHYFIFSEDLDGCIYIEQKEIEDAKMICKFGVGYDIYENTDKRKVEVMQAILDKKLGNTKYGKIKGTDINFVRKEKDDLTFRVNYFLNKYNKLPVPHFYRIEKYLEFTD